MHGTSEGVLGFVVGGSTERRDGIRSHLGVANTDFAGGIDAFGIRHGRLEGRARGGKTRRGAERRGRRRVRSRRKKRRRRRRSESRIGHLSSSVFFSLILRSDNNYNIARDQAINSLLRTRSVCAIVRVASPPIVSFGLKGTRRFIFFSIFFLLLLLQTRQRTRGSRT